jgi:hypothetical protein
MLQPDALSLRELRRALGLTQLELGRRMAKPQEEISRLEQRGDMRLSTLRAYVHSLGGSLELQCRFADRPLQRLRVDRVEEGGDAEVATTPAERLVAPHRAMLIQLCERYAVRRLALFGSALRADYDPRRSDVDFVVDFDRAPQFSPASQYFEFKAALERLFERAVDLVELRALPETRLKRLIQKTQVPVYEQAA